MVKFIKIANNKKRNQIHKIETLASDFQVKPVWYNINPQIHDYSHFRQVKDTNKITIIAYDIG